MGASSAMLLLTFRIRSLLVSISATRSSRKRSRLCHNISIFAYITGRSLEASAYLDRRISVTRQQLIRLYS
jgi:hypothetical protein